MERVKPSFIITPVFVHSLLPVLFICTLVVPWWCSVVTLCHFTITIIHNSMNEIWSTTAIFLVRFFRKQASCRNWTSFRDPELFMHFVTKVKFIMTAELMLVLCISFTSLREWANSASSWSLIYNKQMNEVDLRFFFIFQDVGISIGGLFCSPRQFILPTHQ